MGATQEHRTVRPAELAMHVRLALRRAFPGCRFSVTSHRYAGGSEARVRWTDGPTAGMVDRVVRPFEGIGFDGRDDSTTFRLVTLETGEVVHAYTSVSVGRQVSHYLGQRVLRLWMAHGGGKWHAAREGVQRAPATLQWYEQHALVVADPRDPALLPLAGARLVLVRMKDGAR